VPVDEAVIYRHGNDWQRDRYAFMAEYLAQRGVRQFGRSRNGNAYRHLLAESDAIHNFLGDERILDAVRRRFASHKAGDLVRTLTNTTASTPFCFNLFVPLQLDLALAGALVSRWLAKPVDVAHVEIEFTPNRCDVAGFERREDESLGDQSGSTGTDADVAVFYVDAVGVRGVILIETKYIEAGFSTCTSYRNKVRVRSVCDARHFHERLVRPHLARPPASPDCGYLRFANWALTNKSALFDAAAIANSAGCPFRGSAQQIWRNLLLAERVASARRLDELHFWVLSPVENTHLWQEGTVDVELAVRDLLTPRGREAFRRLELRRDFVEPLRSIARTQQTGWLAKVAERYVPTPAAVAF
jgi:hypothetical protein